jgi:hypothetical protein
MWTSWLDKYPYSLSDIGIGGGYGASTARTRPGTVSLADPSPYYNKSSKGEEKKEEGSSQRTRGAHEEEGISFRNLIPYVHYPPEESKSSKYALYPSDFELPEHYKDTVYDPNYDESAAAAATSPVGRATYPPDFVVPESYKGTIYDPYYDDTKNRAGGGGEQSSSSFSSAARDRRRHIGGVEKGEEGHGKTRKIIIVPVKINGQPVNAILDSTMEYSVIPYSLVDKLQVKLDDHNNG